MVTLYSMKRAGSLCRSGRLTLSHDFHATTWPALDDADDLKIENGHPVVYAGAGRTRLFPAGRIPGGGEPAFAGLAGGLVQG